MPAPGDDDAFMLTREAVRKLQEDHRRLQSLFAAFAAKGNRGAVFDIIPAVWVQTPSAVAPGASAVCTIYRQGVASTDTITVYNRWVNTTFEAGTRAVAGWIDGEWAIVTGECA